MCFNIVTFQSRVTLHSRITLSHNKRMRCLVIFTSIIISVLGNTHIIPCEYHRFLTLSFQFGFGCWLFWGYFWRFLLLQHCVSTAPSVIGKIFSLNSHRSNYFLVDYLMQILGISKIFTEVGKWWLIPIFKGLLYI